MDRWAYQLRKARKDCPTIQNLSKISNLIFLQSRYNWFEPFGRQHSYRTSTSNSSTTSITTKFACRISLGARKTRFKYGEGRIGNLKSVPSPATISLQMRRPTSFSRVWRKENKTCSTLSSIRTWEKVRPKFLFIDSTDLLHQSS